MRNSLLFALLLILSVSGTNCLKGKSCDPKTPGNEAPTIQAYALTNGINAVAHSSGLYYEIIDPGTGATPNLNSKIVITYVGKLLNGSIFDQRNSPNNSEPWPLSELIGPAAGLGLHPAASEPTEPVTAG